MSNGDSETIFKIVMVGNSAVGKTSLIRQLVSQEFFDDNQATVGVEFRPYTMKTSSGADIKLQIWDTAGQERYRSVAKSYIRSSFGALLVFDLTDRKSYESVGDWLQTLNSLTDPNAFILLIGNKSDLADHRAIGTGEATELAHRNNIEYMETSAKTGHLVQEAFVRMGEEIYRRVVKGSIKSETIPSTIDISKSEKNKVEESSCC